MCGREYLELKMNRKGMSVCVCVCVCDLTSTIKGQNYCGYTLILDSLVVFLLM